MTYGRDDYMRRQEAEHDMIRMRDPRYDVRRAVAAKCPRCGSPSPKFHPAVQAGGEVGICPHEFHETTRLA